MVGVAPVQLRVPQVQDFEDISLDDSKHPRVYSLPKRSPTSSVASDEFIGNASNVSTPTLTSDTSSLRSSLSSMSSPTLGYSISHAASGEGQESAISPYLAMKKASATGMVDHTGAPIISSHPVRRKSAPCPSVPLGMGVDNTSMASLSRLPSRRGSRTRKQREMDVDVDGNDDFWPGSGLMFNVPMSPALYRQQQQQQLQQQLHQHQHRHFNQQSHQQAPVQRGRQFHPTVPPHTSHHPSYSHTQTHLSHQFTTAKTAKDQGQEPNSPKKQTESLSGDSAAADSTQPEDIYCKNSTSVAPSPANSSLPQPPAPQSRCMRASLPSIDELEKSVTHSPAASNSPMMLSENRSQRSPIAFRSSFASIASNSSLNTMASVASISSTSASASHRNSKIDGLDLDASDLTLAYALEEELRIDRTRSTPLKAPRTSHGSPSPESPGSRRASLTRPENLPPKDPAEEEAHLKAYEKMMADAAAQERKRKSEKEKKLAKREEQRKADTNAWLAWVKSDGQSKVGRELRWRGIHDNVRSDVWKIQLNKLFKESCVEDLKTMRGDIDEIAQDTDSVWPELAIFGPGHALHEPLVRIVRQYLGAVPDAKYDRAISELGGLLLLYLDEDRAAEGLVGLMAPGSFSHAVLSGNEQLATANTASFTKVLKAKFPRLLQHCSDIQLTSMDIVNPMLKGCMASVLQSPEAAARVLDVLIFEGEAFLLRAALGVVELNEAWLYGSRKEALEQLEKPRIPDSEDEFLRVIRNVTRI